MNIVYKEMQPVVSSSTLGQGMYSENWYNWFFELNRQLAKCWACGRHELNLKSGLCTKGCYK